MASIDGRRTQLRGGITALPSGRVLAGVYGLLGVGNLFLMIPEPTAWQGTFATALLGAGTWLWVNNPKGTKS